ncbi:GNAT family N-acetyltransferase [Paenibacillus wynnii]|uniref:GNAT family acetyltransferase n=1 Tax=Paenibacillus wynnii TaxID=268407 RepID=A0A098M4Y2_9BACL|nr:GNAT family N-acetyltransferase [Paenibacillus wynnii]KGE17093.1 GNAT family acetyltransferase [Paenibacillus wynnii]
MIKKETDRLIIRNFIPSDWKDLYEYLSLDDVLKYEPVGACDVEECRRFALERSKGNNFWAVILRDEEKMIGHVYFNQIEPYEFMTWEIGYIFNPKFYGNGYATEACRGILQYGFNELKIHRVIALCNPENIASWRLMERLNMRREAYHKKKAFFHKTEEGEPLWHDAYQYAILEEELNDFSS